MALDALATLVVIFYFLLITCVGVWAGRKLHFGDSRQKRTYTYRLNRSKYRKERHREEQLFLLRLFLCERKLTILLGFATVTATWVGGGYLNAAAEVVYTSGIIWCYAPLGYAVSLLLGGGLFASKMRSTDSFTMLDPFQRRFGKWVVLLPIVPALCGELCWSAAILTALGTAVEVMVGFNSSTVAIVVSSFVALFYTALGGLYSVIYTDIYQIITSAAGLWYCVPFVFRNSAVGTIKGPDADWVGSMDFGDIVVALDFFLMTALGGISWQVYFQRVLSAATELDARVFSYLSAVGCIFLALPPVIMGAAATTANFTQAGYRGPFRLMDEDLHRALPYIMHLLMPRLQAVIGMLAIMTAVMSSFDSSTLSAATMITRNVYQELVRPKAGVKEIATVLRTAVVGFGGVATVMALWVSPNSVYSLPQHLCGLHLVRDICGGRLEGGHIGSTEITLYPGPIRGGNYKADTGTAGSVVLLLQVALPCLLFADGPSQLYLHGGTNADMAPHIDYTIRVFAPVVQKFGAHFDIRVLRRGYFPKGGGEVEVEVKPCQKLDPITLLDPGEVTKITGRSFVAGSLPIKVAHIMADFAVSTVRRQWPATPCTVERLKESEANAYGTGNGIILTAESSTGCQWSGSALGKRGTPAEAVGESAARDLLKELENTSCVDSYLQDQLVIFMALASGKSRILSGPLTLHTETAIHVAHILTKAKFTSSQEEASYFLECNGAAFTPS